MASNLTFADYVIRVSRVTPCSMLTNTLPYLSIRYQVPGVVDIMLVNTNMTTTICNTQQKTGRHVVYPVAPRVLCRMPRIQLAASVALFSHCIRYCGKGKSRSVRLSQGCASKLPTSNSTLHRNRKPELRVRQDSILLLVTLLLLS